MDFASQSISQEVLTALKDIVTELREIRRELSYISTAINTNK